MADEAGAAAAPEAKPQAQAPQMKIRSQFIKDLSFENVASQKQKAPSQAPDVKVGVKLDAKKLTDSDYEVVMTLEVKATAGEDVLFVLEMDYAGLFHIQNVPNEQLHPFLMIECPRMLFPFVRRVVSDVTRDGGFPPVNVDSIDFLQAEQQQQANGATA
jgi:preprotein translocase subunit SecB